MIIDCISDLHGHYPKLEGGDLLIVAGDLTTHDTKDEYISFINWIVSQKYIRKVVIAGNHDNIVQKDEDFFHINRIDEYFDFDYLCDSGTEFEGIKIWGSPWTKKFKGMNQNCMAFTCDTDDELFEKFKLIPTDVDALITHSPPWTILDETIDGEQVGSSYLMGALIYCFRPKLWVFGHIHEGYGQYNYKGMTKLVNASHMNINYQPINPPIRIIL